MTNTGSAGKAPRVPYGLDEHEAGALARLADRYAGDLPGIQRREAVRVLAVVHAVCGHQASRLFKTSRLYTKTMGPAAEEPEDRARDVADALSLLRAARADLDGLDAALLMAARQPGTSTGKPLLTFRQIAAAIGAESEQAAQGRYRRKVGSLNGSDSRSDGTP
ncbi:MAG: hypothetical protein ACRDOH_01485 [Streptosporangiaceae bacterium]